MELRTLDLRGRSESTDAYVLRLPNSVAVLAIRRPARSMMPPALSLPVGPLSASGSSVGSTSLPISYSVLTAPGSAPLVASSPPRVGSVAPMGPPAPAPPIAPEAPMPPDGPAQPEASGAPLMSPSPSFRCGLASSAGRSAWIRSSSLVASWRPGIVLLSPSISPSSCGCHSAINARRAPEAAEFGVAGTHRSTCSTCRPHTTTSGRLPACSHARRSGTSDGDDGPARRESGLDLPRRPETDAAGRTGPAPAPRRCRAHGQAGNRIVDCRCGWTGNALGWADHLDSVVRGALGAGSAA